MSQQIPNKILEKYLGCRLQVFYAERIRGERTYTDGVLRRSSDGKHFLLDHHAFSLAADEVRVYGVTVWSRRRWTTYTAVKETVTPAGLVKTPRCTDCGQVGQSAGHMTCLFPNDETPV